MFDRSLRPQKSRALAPMACRLDRVEPVVITAAGLAVGLGAAALAAAGWWLAALVAWLINRLADGLDGEVARRRNTEGDLGGYLDLVADAVVYGSLPIGVAAGIDHPNAWVAAAFLLAAFYVNITTVTMLAAIIEKRSARGVSTGGSRGESRGATGGGARAESATICLPSGLIEGSETVLFFAVVLAVPTRAVELMGLMAAAVVATAAIRVARAWPALTTDDLDPVPFGGRR